MIKLATTLFADVVGSTAMGERLGPDELRALLAELFGILSEEIIIQGGTIEKVLGDAITGVFGVPVAHEDDACRAVKCGLKMLKRVENMNVSRPEDRKLQIRIGINTGEVSAQGSFAPQLLVVGDSVNVAARIESAAEPGTILIGERTARAVRELFYLREVAPITAKGKTDPVRAFVVEGERDAPDQPLPVAPIIGRDAELSRLLGIFQRVEGDDTPHLVTVVGEPGAGKTRLAEELASVVATRAQLLVGRCPQSETGITLWPFRDILRTAAGLSSDDTPEHALKKIEDLMKESDGEEPPSGSAPGAALGATIGLEPALTALAGLDPRELRRDMFNAWVGFLRGLSSRRPVLVVIEDVHWADHATLELITYLTEAVEGALLFVCPARPDFLITNADWVAGLRDYTSIRLTPLREEASKQLASQVLDGADVPDEVADKLVERAAGNPLFIRELSLRVLDEDPGNQARDWGRIDIPDSVQALIQARLDLLPSEERAVIQRAAVAGRTFWEGLLRELSSVQDLDVVLRDLIRRQLVSKRMTSAIAGDTEFHFDHVLIRDVSYESLPRRVRGETHAQVARWVEQRRAGRAAEFAEILSQHYGLAFDLLKEDGHRARARGYALVAAQNAMRRYAVEAAEEQGSRAIALSNTGREKVEALDAIGDLYLLTQRSQRAYQAYKDALQEQRQTDPDERSHIGGLAGKAAIVATRWWGTMDQLPPGEELAELIEEGLDACGTEPSVSRARLLCSSNFATFLGFNFDGDGTRNARATVELAEETGQADVISMANDALVASLFPAGSWQEIHQINLRRVELVPQLRDVREICDAYGMAAMSASRKGLFADAQRFADNEVVRARGIDSGSYLQGLVWGAVSNFMLGDWQRVLTEQQEIERMQPPGSALPGPMAMRAYVVAMLCCDLRGEISEADRYLDLFKRYVQTERDRGFAVGGLPEAARVLARRGDFAAARELLPLERGEFLSLHLEAFCEVVRLEETWEDSDQIVSLALKEADQEELPLLRCLALRLQGAAALAGGADREGVELLERSAAGFSETGAVWEEALSRLLLAEDIYGLNDSAAVEHARGAAATFKHLGSVAETERAERLLHRKTSPSRRL